MINHIITFVILPFLHFDATNLKAYQLQTAVDSRVSHERCPFRSPHISPHGHGCHGLRRTEVGLRRPTDWAWRPRQRSQRMFGQKLSEFNVLNIISPLAQTHILEYVIRCPTSEQLHSFSRTKGCKVVHLWHFKNRSHMGQPGSQVQWANGQWQ